MKANQWTMKSAKHEFPSAQKSRGPGGNLQGARIHSSCFGGLGSSLPGETTGKRSCAKAQERQRKEMAHKRGRKRPRKQVVQIYFGGPPSSHLLDVSILKPGKEFGEGQSPLVYARHFTYAFPFHPARSSMRGRRLTLANYLTTYQALCMNTIRWSYHSRLTNEDN